AAKTADFDIAILDVNLDGEPVSPVADALVARGTPFVFATGYGERGLPEPYRDRPMLKEPFQVDGLKEMLQTALEKEMKSTARPSDAVLSSSGKADDPVTANVAFTGKYRVYWMPASAGMTPVSQSNNSASCVMNGSSVISSRSGVTAMRLSASAEISLPSAGG